MSNTTFTLSEHFIEKYKRKKAVFGFGALGEVVYARTYSRQKANGVSEKWWETVRRVVEGCYTMQKEWIEEHQLGWNQMKAQLSAQEMYDRIYTMKFLPPGRGLFAMGSSIITERKLHAALFNCAFTSTQWIDSEAAKPFLFLMDMSLLGVGVGFDTKGAGKVMVKGQSTKRTPEKHVIGDSREGWIESVRLLIESFFYGTASLDFDYSQIRPAGALIKGFGGISSGSGPLKDCHTSIAKVLARNTGEMITVTTIVDIMNIIGKCVVSGNVRRTAEIVFGDPTSEEYVDLKNYEINPERAEFGWTSNNSILASLGMNYAAVAERTRVNGEPGYAWLENMQNYSRMNNGPDFKDSRALGANPCAEQTLEHLEMCCLVETFPAKHDSLEDYIKTLKYAYLYGKTVTLSKTHWPETNRVMLRNRRIGCSMSGVAQFLAKFGIHSLKSWCEEGFTAINRYDDLYSDWLAIPKSIKMTSIKPSGTVSLLAGATPGIHYPEGRFYIRRVRMSNNSPLLKPIERAGYKVEPALEDARTTVVVEFPVDAGTGIRSKYDVSMWEKLQLASFMQKYWADNQVSCTVEFDPEREGHDIANALNYFQYQMKAISFLPLSRKHYKQMPYEAITEAVYIETMKKISPLDLSRLEGDTNEVRDSFCDGEACTLGTKK